MGAKKIDYYNIEETLTRYPDAWAYIIIGGRGIGKTYSTLNYMLDEKERFVFVKRTMDDVDLICAGNGRIGSKPKKDENGSIISTDFSPFKPINRDRGTTIGAWKIRSGIGGFWRTGSEGEAFGPCIGYIAALSGVTKFKGFDMSEADYMIFDEFIPQPWERINREEGNQILDLYKTIGRDREQRGRGPLKLVALANATEINSPLTAVLEVTDALAEMIESGEHEMYIANTGIVLQLLQTPDTFADAEKNTALYRALSSTEWGRMAYSNEFAYNDRSSVRRQRLKGFRPWLQVTYKGKTWYIWRSDTGNIYCCRSAFSKTDTPPIDLSKENDQKRFYRDFYFDIKNATMEDRATYETYTMYDVIVNYKQFFRV